MPEIQIYTTNICPYCVMAKRLLDKKGARYTEINVDAILESIKEKYKKQPVNTIDGVKIEFDKAWVHLRRSNTEAIIRIYSESESETTADNLAKKIMSDIREFIKMQQITA